MEPVSNPVTASPDQTMFVVDGRPPRCLVFSRLAGAVRVQPSRAAYQTARTLTRCDSEPVSNPVTASPDQTMSVVDGRPPRCLVFSRLADSPCVRCYGRGRGTCESVCSPRLRVAPVQERRWTGRSRHGIARPSQTLWSRLGGSLPLVQPSRGCAALAAVGTR